jgi:hypothetical protein
LSYDMVLEDRYGGTSAHPRPDALGRVRPTLFSVSISAMHYLRARMTEFGMLDWDREEPVIDQPYEYFISLPANSLEARAIYEAELASGRGPLIPTFKFLSNDWWLVTPAEIESALAANGERDLRDLGQEVEQRLSAAAEECLDPGVSEQLWREWIEYLHDALDTDGFRVG